MQVPSVLPRVVTIPSDEDNCTTIILLEEIIEKNIQKLFLNYKVSCTTQFRVMRNADLTIDEDEAADLLIEIEKQLKKRQWGEAIRWRQRQDRQTPVKDPPQRTSHSRRIHFQDQWSSGSYFPDESIWTGRF